MREEYTVVNTKFVMVIDATGHQMGDVPNSMGNGIGQKSIRPPEAERSLGSRVMFKD